MLDLDPVLQIAQDGMSHHPIISMLSQSAAADFPMLGSLLNITATNESKPNTIMHTSGRVCLIYLSGTVSLEYAFTDANRQEFAKVNLGTIVGNVFHEGSIVELADGSIGVLFITDDGSSYYLRSMIISPTGEVVTAQSSIFSVAMASYTITGPSVVRLENGAYLMVYPHLTVSGGAWHLRKRTSVDFASWSAEGTIDLGADHNHIANSSLLQITTGQLWLWYEHTDSISGTSELVNIYYATSDDDGSSWAAPVKFTEYDGYDTTASHPFAVQKSANQMHVLYNEVRSVLKIIRETEGKCNYTAGNFWVLDHVFDSVNRKLYITCYNDGWAVVRVDVDTWTVDACWSAETTPAFDDVFNHEGAGSSAYWRCHSEGSYVAWGTMIKGNHFHIAVLDGESDTIKHYHFQDWSAYSIEKNVNFTDHGCSYMADVWIDQASMRMYVVLEKYGGGNAVHIGYIDLTQTINEEDPDSHYTFVDVLFEASLPNFSTVLYEAYGSFQLLPDEDLCIITSGERASSGAGETRVYVMSSWTLYKSYTHANNSSYPRRGIQRFIYLDGKIYGNFYYDSSEGEVDKRGLCVIDLATDGITYERPSWATIDEYNLKPMCVIGADKIMLSSNTYGVTIYSIFDHSWELYDNDDIPNLDSVNVGGNLPYQYSFGRSTYDPATGLVFSSQQEWPAYVELTAFNYLGSMLRSRYQEGTYTASWDWEDKGFLLQGLYDHDAVAALDPSDQSMFVFWTEKELSEYSVRWGKEGAALDLNDFLLRGSEISIQRKIDGSPAELRFSVSNGHLFDVHNRSSLLSIYLKKGRRVVVQLGERVSGYDYFQDQGTFMVSETRLRYKKGEYPAMEVTAYDRMVLFESANVIATDSYEDYPEDVLSDVLATFLDFDPDAEIDLPVFDDRQKVYQQWVESSVKEIIEQVCDRFGYFPRVNVDGKFSARKIFNDSSIIHIYSSRDQLVDFTPEDSFSDFVNRIIVEGNERSFIEVLHTEERIKSMNGTVGWWGFKKDFMIYYSDDKSRTCRDPRLVVLEAASSIAFQLAGSISESITAEDPDEKYCVVTVEAPNLIPMLLAGIGVYYAGGAVPDIVIAYGTGYTIPTGRIIERIGMYAVLMILCAVGNYQYEIWARPVGSVRRSIQGQADDLELQNELKAVVLKKFADPLCNTVADCELVADHEMMVAMNQRKRVKSSKIAHLQDEEGDTIQIPHPYTEAAMKIFITDLTRKIVIPSLDQGDGSWIDEIEGWDVTA